MDDVANLPQTLRWLVLECEVDPNGLHLLSQKLERMSYQSSYQNPLTATIAALLPRSLTHLTLTGRVLEEALTTLPPRLVYFRLSGATCSSPTAIRALPSTLQELYMNSYTQTRDPLPFSEDLPRGLRILHLNDLRCQIEDIKHLPPQLQHVQIINKEFTIPLEALCYLPKSLQRVDLSSLVVTDETLEHLHHFFPETLQQEPFSLRRFSISIQKSHQGLPIPFSRISFPAGVDYRFTEKSLLYVPRTTQSLELDVGTFWTDLCIPTLPSHLTSLSLSTATSITDQGVQAMPATLTKLSMPHCDQFTENLLSILLSPDKSIKSIRLGAMTLGRMIMEHIISSCTTLSLPALIQAATLMIGHKTQLTMHTESGWVEKLTDDTLAHTPEHITTIVLAGVNLSPVVLQLIPNHITDLRLERLVKISEATLSRLPPRLTRLDLPWVDSVMDQDIDRLPAGLTHLDLRYAKWLTDDCIRTLPRALTYLNVSSAILTDESVPHLPQLRILCADYAKITESSVSQWPRSLTKVELGDSPRFQNVNFANLPPHLVNIKWRWTKPMILACQHSRPNITIPQMVLYREGLITVEKV
jgi:hypothetical protein